MASDNAGKSTKSPLVNHGDDPAPAGNIESNISWTSGWIRIWKRTQFYHPNLIYPNLPKPILILTYIPFSFVFQIFKLSFRFDFKNNKFETFVLRLHETIYETERNIFYEVNTKC